MSGTGDTCSGTARRRPPRLEVDPQAPERSLVALVLAIVELLRQLMERQALRRMEHGDLDDAQLERLGSTLMALDEQLTQLREQFGLTVEDLNLDLGPLGSLLPRDSGSAPPQAPQAPQQAGSAGDRTGQI